MWRLLFCTVLVMCPSLNAGSKNAAEKSGAMKLADLFLGNWEGELIIEVDEKKESEKSTMRCKVLGENFGAECVFTAGESSELWFIGHNEKNASDHIFIMTAKSAHDHAAQWLSSNEIDVTPITNNPDKCGVLSFTLKRVDDMNLLAQGTEMNKKGQLVKFASKLKRIQ